MFHKQTMIGRGQMGFYSLEDLVPQDHLLRHIDQYVDFDFIYDLVVDKYSLEYGRPSLDPVMTCHISQLLVKIIADVSKTLTYLNRFSITFWIKLLRRN